MNTINNVVLHGDCLDLMDSLDKNSIDLIITDLPYGISDCEWDKKIDLKELWVQFKKVIIEHGVVVLFSVQPFTTDLIDSNRKWYKYNWYWKKNNVTGYLNAKFSPMKTVEDICVFCDSNKNIYNPQGIIDTYVERIENDDSNLIKGVLPKKYIQTKTNYPKNLLEIDRDCNFTNQLHTSQKPVKLYEYLIKTYTNENMNVLDCCAGSGTAAIACINTNRRYILIEKDEKNYTIILNRIKNHTDIQESFI